MAKFLKVHASLHGYEGASRTNSREGSGADARLQDRYINIDDIVEVVAANPRNDKDENDQDVQIPTTHLYMLEGPPTIVGLSNNASHAVVDHHVAYFRADGALADIMAKIKALTDPPPPPAPAPPPPQVGATFVSLSQDYPLRLSRDSRLHGMSAATPCTTHFISEDELGEEVVKVPRHATVPNSATHAMARIQNNMTGKKVVLTGADNTVRNVNPGVNHLLYGTEVQQEWTVTVATI